MTDVGSRAPFGWAPLVVLFVVGFVDRIEHNLLACSLLAIAMPNLTACLADVVPAAARGLGFAVLQLLTTGGGAFGPLVVGIASDRFGSLPAGMYLLVVPMVVGGLLTLRARTSFERDARKVLDLAARG